MNFFFVGRGYVPDVTYHAINPKYLIFLFYINFLVQVPHLGQYAFKG